MYKKGDVCMKVFDLWENIPGTYANVPTIDYYPAENKTTDGTIVILPGGGYEFRAEHEGKGYAEFLNAQGMDAFVCQYRVAPDRYPVPLLDARRAIQFVRYHAEEFGINPEKVGIMGSSAGGHLAAVLSTVKDEFSDYIIESDEIDKMNYMPDFQVLCYPVISICKGFGHKESGHNLLGTEDLEHPLREHLAPHKLVDENTPPAFLWHTATDRSVSVDNSFAYTWALKDKGVEVEFHTLPFGGHGMGIAQDRPYVHQWTTFLCNWLKYKQFL